MEAKVKCLVDGNASDRRQHGPVRQQEELLLTNGKGC